MKVFLATLLVAVLSLHSAFSQVNFTVSGFAPVGTKRLVVYDMCRKMAIGEVGIRDGRFLVSGNVAKETVISFIDQEQRLQSYVIVDVPSLSVDMRTDAMQGSPINLRFSKVVQELTRIQKVYVDNHRSAMTTTNADSVGVYTARALEARKKEMAYYRTVFDANRDNTIGAFALSQMSKTLSYAEMDAIFATNATSLNHPLAKPVRTAYEGLRQRHPGMRVPDMVAADVAGVQHSLSEYVGKGNYVLVDFWASWCSPCIVEMPNVKNNYEKYRDRGFMVVGVSFDTKAEAWQKAIVDNDLDWVHLSDLKGWASIAAKTYGIRAIPASILVDGNGKIVAIDLRGQALADKLRRIYGD